jgi:glycerate-2-kinase
MSPGTAIQGSETAARADLQRLYRAAIDAVDPQILIARALAGECAGAADVPRLIAEAPRIFLLAVGKASAAMARAIERQIGSKLADAIAVVPKREPDEMRSLLSPRSKVRVFPASHPIPDESSEAAAHLACAMLLSTTPDDLLIVALSGGASAMFTMPAPGISLADKIAINQALLKAGASIRELNVVRKHLSAVKGGRLLQRCRGARVLGLILSDVPGNELATIGSGLTAVDWSTYGDAVVVLKRLDVWGRAPEAVREFLERAIAGENSETLKSNDPILKRVTNVIVGDSALALNQLEITAAAMGYHPQRWKEMHREANNIGRALAEYMREITEERVCVIAGGEPVVTVHGNGRGGRAQQCALAMSIELAQTCADRQIAALFAGTDGIDGPTDAAGAFASPTVVARGAAANVNAAVALARNDAYNFFKASGDLFITGPTGTNVSDIFIGLVNY